MRLNYKRIGDYIRIIKDKNNDGKLSELLGININKYFMPSVANVNGTDLKKYKIVKPKQFSCNRMHVGRDKKLPVALSNLNYSFIVSPAYDVFEIIDTNKLLPEYLMMWFSREEFDRNAWFYTDTDVRGRLGWDDFCDMTLPVPSIEKQQEIVDEYQTVINRIKLNEELNQKLEETAQAIYKEWFVDINDYDNTTTLQKYVVINPKHNIRKGCNTSYVEMADLQEDKLSVKSVRTRTFTSGSKFKNGDTVLARITPCLENGKTAFIDCLENDKIAFGSTEFIVMRAKKDISPYWVYCLARSKDFRSYAISSMVGSSGRQRVQSDYLNIYHINKIDKEKMNLFHGEVRELFEKVKNKVRENKLLEAMQVILLSKMTKL